MAVRKVIAGKDKGLKRMAEETSVFKNKTLLIVAVVIAIVVAILYNWRIEQVRRAGEGETIKVLKLRNSVASGEVLSVDDLEEVSIETRFAGNMGSLVKATRQEIAGSKLTQAVKGGEYLFWSQIGGDRAQNPSHTLESKCVAFTLPISNPPGMFLSIGDKIELIGQLAIPGEGLQSCRIIEGVKVLAIGGVTTRTKRIGGKSRKLSRGNQRNYRTVTIEVTRDAALRLDAILSHVREPVRINVLPPSDYADINIKPKVSPRLRNLGVKKNR